jgi:hypothetical protein
MAPDPTFAFVGGPWCPTLDFVIAFWIMIYVSHIVYESLVLFLCVLFFKNVSIEYIGHNEQLIITPKLIDILP